MPNVTKIFSWLNISCINSILYQKTIITITVGAKIVLCQEIFNTINILPLARRYFQYWHVLHTI